MEGSVEYSSLENEGQTGEKRSGNRYLSRQTAEIEMPSSSYLLQSVFDSSGAQQD